MSGNERCAAACMLVAEVEDKTPRRADWTKISLLYLLLIVLLMGQTLTNECHYTGPTVPARPRCVLSPDATLTHPSCPGRSHQVWITAQASLRLNKLVPSVTVTDNSFWPPCYTARWFRARSICCLLPRYNVYYYTCPAIRRHQLCQ